VYDFAGMKAMLDGRFVDGRVLQVVASAADGTKKTFAAKVRIDTPQEIEYFEHGGILQYVLRQLAAR